MSTHNMPSTSMWPFPLSARSEHLIAGENVTSLIEKWANPSITLEEHVWISRKDQQQLLDQDHAQLVDSDNRILARIGNGGTQIQAIESFLIRYPWHLLEIAEQVINELSEDSIAGEVHPHAVIEGKITLGKGSRILPGVYIEGNVVIGEDCKIGPNCYIRGNSSIGNGVHIGQSVEVKNSVIGNNTSIGHLSYVGDSVIGDGVNFGAGTITSNFRHDGSNHRSAVNGTLIDTGRRKFGTAIGDAVHTGINTSIYPGRKLEARSSTLPGSVVLEDLFN